MAAGWFPPDVRRDEDEHFSEPTLIERVFEYDMRMPVEEQLGLRVRLAEGLVYPGEPAPIRHIESARVKDPVTGEWSEL